MKEELTEKQIRKDWHEFFIKNKERFTDSEIEARKDKNKIYIDKEYNCFKNSVPPTYGEWQEGYK